eukprot:gene35523-43071_t
MPRRKRAKDFFDMPYWTPSNFSEASDSEMDVDENILRLLSESDTSMEHSGQSAHTPPRRDVKSEKVGLDHLYSSPMRAPFHSADLGTPLAHGASPPVIEMAWADDGGKGDMRRGGVPSPPYEANTSVEESSELLVSTQKKRRAGGEQHFPLPDPHAFDLDPPHTQHVLSPASLSCPPTPERSPLWLEESALAPFHRQNSLGDTKPLLGRGAKELGIGGISAFKVLRLLGTGTFATVHLVQAREGGQRFALKKTRQRFRNRKARDYQLHEVRVLQRLMEGGGAGLQHLVPLHACWQEGGFLYVLLGLCAGGSLRDLQQHLNGALPLTTLLATLHDVCQGLGYVHRKGVVHLDVKPANLLLSGGRVLLGDFGMAAEAGSTEDEREGDTKYLPPELLQFSSPRWPSADMFSLGLSMYELALEEGGLPCEGDGWQRLRHDSYPPLPASSRRPPAFCQLIYALLCSDASRRPTAEEVGTNLLRIRPETSSWSLPDPTLLEWEREQERRAEQSISAQGSLSSAAPDLQPVPLHRSASFQPNMATPHPQPLSVSIPPPSLPGGHSAQVPLPPYSLCTPR